MKVCIVGASGKLGRYMVQHPFKGRITVIPGQTNDRG